MSLNTKAYLKIKNKLLMEDPNVENPFTLWRPFKGFFGIHKYPMRNNVEMKLTLNKTPEHCICGHKTGKITRKSPQTNDSTEEKTYLDDIVNELQEQTNTELEERNVVNSIDISKKFKDCSLIPFVKKTGDTVIYVGKECSKHFNHKSEGKKAKKKIESKVVLQTTLGNNIMENPFLFDRIQAYEDNEKIMDALFSISKEDRTNPENIYIIGTSIGNKILLSKLDKYGIKDITKIKNILFRKGFSKIPIQVSDCITLTLNTTINTGLVLANIEFLHLDFVCQINIKQITYL
jgi:hypothetical protein